MPHHRTTVRGNTKTQLTGLAKTGSNVFANRAKRMTAQNRPGLIIFIEDEEAERVGMGEQDQIADRKPNLVVEGYVSVTDDVDDELDQVALEVEIAMAGDRTLSGAVRDLMLTRTELGFSGEGDDEAGVVRLVYAVDYTVNESNPIAAV